MTALFASYRNPSIKSSWQHNVRSTVMPPSRFYSAEDVESALEAVHQVTAEYETNDKQVDNDEEKGKGATYKCRNPFCQATLCNPFACFCEDRTICQRYRALQLQCLVNGENVATIQALVRGDIFVAERVAQHSNSKIAEDKEKSRPETPFIIPRRKRPSTQAVDSNVPSRKVKIRKTSDVDMNAVQGTSQQAKPRLGHRMHFNDVLAFFEPQTPRAAAPSASTQTRARRITEASRRARMAKMTRRNGATPKPLPITRNLQNSGGGGRYVQSGNRSSLNSMRGLALISRPAYRPSPSSRVQAPATPRTDSNVSGVAVSAEHRQSSTRQMPSVCTSEQIGSSSQSQHSARANFGTRTRPHPFHGEHTREPSQLREHWQPRPLNNQQWAQAELHRASSEIERTGYEHSRGIGVPPESENGRFARYSDASSRSTSRKSFNFAGKHRPFTNNGSRFCARRELHGDGEFCRELRNNYDRGTTAGRIWEVNRERERDVTPTSGYSRIVPSHNEFGHDEDSIGADELSADHSVPTEEWSRDLRNNVSSEARTEQPGHRTVEPRTVKTAKAVQHASSDASADCEPTFSFHDAFIQPLLSTFIQKLPKQLEPVMNVTKKPRKISWYTEYTKKIERACKPYLRIQLQTLQVVVKVQNRVWLKLKGSSTILLLQETLKTIRAEAISWRQLKAEFEECLELYRKRVGDDVELSNVFLRAWSNFKSCRGPLSLPQQSNYFCGSHFHHWNFVVGKIEIGSGSHDKKRETFHLAAASAAEFLLRLDDNRNDQRWRPNPRDLYSSDSSEECEFLYVRDANSETVGADSVIALCESPDSATEDVTIVDSTAAPQTTPGEQAAATIESTSQVDASSDTEGEEPPNFDDSTAEDTSDTVVAASVEPTTSTLTEQTSLQDNTATKSRQCNMCDVIRMRKPDSAGCRRCQSAEESKTSENKTTPRPDSCQTTDEQLIDVAEPVSAPPKRLTRLFEDTFRKMG